MASNIHPTTTVSLLPESIAHSDGIATNNSYPPSQTPPINLPELLQVLPQDFYVHYMSEQAKEQLPSPIRKFMDLAKTPGMLALFAGLPAAETFPITSLSMTVRSPVDPTHGTSLTLDEPSMMEALQYSAVRGIPSLTNWLVGLQKQVHRRNENEGWRLTIGAGSQDLLYKAFSSVLNPGDAVLAEAPVYAGIIPLFKSMKCDIAEVESDENGISSECMETVLKNWPEGRPKPKVLYTIPYGCNPTGMSASTERRIRVLDLARKHGILIFEDDPYYYTYYGDAPRPPSYFRLEAERADYPVGMVVRFDSFSKVLSAGLRIGFACGPSAIIDAIDLHTASSNLQPSSFSQVIAFTLLNHWGYSGFHAHTDSISGVYRRRRDIFGAAMKKHLSGLAEWRSPEAGMFFWFKLLLPPSLNDESEGDSELVTLKHGVEKGVLALPGTLFFALGRKTAYVRASFSILDEPQMEEAVRRLADALKEVWSRTYD